LIILSILFFCVLAIPAILFIRAFVITVIRQAREKSKEKRKMVYLSYIVAYVLGYIVAFGLIGVSIHLYESNRHILSIVALWAGVIVFGIMIDLSRETKNER